MSSLSSKLSSSQKSASKATAPAPSNSQDASSSPPKSTSSGIPSDFEAYKQRSTVDEVIEEEDTSSYTPASPKPGGGSFFSSALRRLSNASINAPVEVTPMHHAPLCERRVLNVDKGRDRPSVAGLKQAKLRRVSFSVDVEIAGSSRYPTESDTPEDALEKKLKKKEKKGMQRSEGEALKHPEAVIEEKAKEEKAKEEKPEPKKAIEVKSKDVKDKYHVVRVNGKVMDDFPNPYGNMAGKGAVDNTQYMSPQSKTPKTTPATAKPSTPAADKVDGAQGTRSRSTSDQTKAADVPAPDAAPTPPVKVQDRPTTDPLRIYRRCCQLREGPVLKRISEQLGSPSNCGVDAPGVVTCLNLNRSRMQLTDIVCLSDFLAVVPVKQLLLDDANLTDEGVRIILAGLLAAKLPEPHKRKRGKSSPSRPRPNTVVRSPGVIEKLTFKNNKKLTAEAWRHICLFLHLSKSIKAVDLSMNAFPKTKEPGETQSVKSDNSQAVPNDIAELLCQCISNRLGGDTLAELLFGDCSLDDYHVAKITEGAAKMRLQRLGLAGNRVTEDGLKHIATYLKADVCRGIDLGGINMHEKLPIIMEALESTSPLQFLSFANCNLVPSDLKPCFEKLVNLTDLRFLDFSHNRKLFSEQKGKTLCILRHYLPKLRMMKRVHLMDVSLTAADVIGIAEIVPEVRNLAHLNLLENPELAAVASAKDPASSEEACALYASLMTAVRLSKTMVCVDIEVPGKDSSEVVRALARQVVAYCLRNLELFAQGDALRVADAAAALPDVSDANTDIMADIVGRTDSGTNMTNLPAAAKNEDYLVGGQGWVKALSHVLNAADARDGSSSPTLNLESEGGKARAKEMSRDLLQSARHFRTRLQSVLAREEASTGDYEVLSESFLRIQHNVTNMLTAAGRLQFLDHTIQSIIERFEAEYPECRCNDPLPTPEPDTEAIAEADEPVDPAPATSPPIFTGPYAPTVAGSEAAAASPLHSAGTSRRGSATDLASFAQASEEATFHRFGQRFRRDLLPPKGMDDKLHGTTVDDPEEPEYVLELRRRLETIGGEEFREKVNRIGWEATLRDLKEEMESLKRQETESRESVRQPIEGQ